MNVTERTTGRLLDTYTLAAVEEALDDQVVRHAREDKNDVLRTAIEGMGHAQLGELVGFIVEMTIERCIISINRKFLRENPDKVEVMRRFIEGNVRRTDMVRKIDSITNPDTLSFAPKTYATVSRIRTIPIIVDDLVSSRIKVRLDLSNEELQDRVNVLEKYLQEVLKDSLGVELINLAVASTTCFFIHEMTIRKNDEAGVIESMRSIMESNKLRKLAMQAVARETGDE